MTFTPKAWADGSGGGTPVTAAALVDEETRLSTYTDQQTQVSAIQALLTAGHSRIAETGSTTDSYGVSHKTARRLGAQLSMIANGGSLLCCPEGANIGGSALYGGLGRLLQFVTNARTAAPYLPAWQAAVLDWGLNDMAWMGPTTFATVFPHGIRGAITRLRAGRIWEDTDAAFAYTGASWTNVTGTAMNSGTQVKQVTANGDLATLTVPADFPGGVLAVRFQTQASGAGALWTITGTGCCSGVSTTFDTRNINGFNFGSSIGATGRALSSVVRLTGLPAGAGTLIITATTITTSAQLDCVELESAFPGPVAAGLDVRPVNYTVYNSSPYGPSQGFSDSDTTTVWNTVNSVCAEFDSNVFGAASDDLFLKNPIYFAADGAHWNDWGHALAADRLATLIGQHTTALLLTIAGGFFKPWFNPLDGTNQGPLYATGWADFNPAWEKGGWRKDTLSGRVQIAGTAQKTGGAATDAIFTLPAGYRPAQTLSLPTTVFNGGTYQTAQIQITSAGVVNIASGGSIAAGNASILNCDFQAEQ